MLKKQTKVYLSEKSFCLGLSIVEIENPRTDYVRRIIFRLNEVNFKKILKKLFKRDKVYKRLCICENKSPRVKSNSQVPVKIIMGIICGKR
jgi:hypothetical protein